MFALDLGWAVCCRRIAAVDADKCYCDGAVAAAMESAARADIHERVMDAIPGACGLQARGVLRTRARPTLNLLLLPHATI